MGVDFDAFGHNEMWSFTPEICSSVPNRVDEHDCRTQTYQNTLNDTTETRKADGYNSHVARCFFP